MLTITTNVASLNAQRQLHTNSNALSESFQRLSSGMRINSAKDDAAGLAISNRLTSQIRGLNQSVRNANDGISLAQTAESALDEIGSMLQRVRELAVQSANDTYTATDRAAIQAEVDQLVSEMDRIATQTEFNGRALLDGSFNNMKFHVGAYEDQNIEYSISTARVFNMGTVASKTAQVSTAALSGVLALNGVTIRATTASDDLLSSSGNSSSAIAKARAINEKYAETGVQASVEAATTTIGAVAAGSYDATDNLIINGVDIGPVSVAADDSDSALRNAINAVAGSTGVLASLDGANNLVLTAEDGRNIQVASDGNVAGVGGTALVGATVDVFRGGVTLESDDDYTVVSGAEIGFLASETVQVSTAINVSNVDLGSQAGANSAIGLLDVAIRQVSTQQAQLGAMLSRMDAAVSNLSAASENISAARGRIRDADFAAETATFSKNQILQQAATAMLAQANVSTQAALQLIGG